MTYHGLPTNLMVKNSMGARAYPLDIGVPAVTGVYDTKKLLVLDGLIGSNTSAPAGLYIQMQVIHHT